MCVGVSTLNPLDDKPVKPASFLDALIPISVLICLLGAPNKQIKTEIGINASRNEAGFTGLSSNGFKVETPTHIQRV